MTRLMGTPVSPGIAIGTSQIILVQEIPVVKTSIPPEAAAAEVERLKRALEATIKDVENLKERARSRLSEDFLAIFDAHIIILKDPALLRGAKARIERNGVNAEYALQGSIQDMVRGLMATDDPYFQERAMDVEGLHRRVQQHLAGPLPERTTWSSGERVVILADTLTPSETSTLHNAPVVAFATEHGARTSHTAIIARSLEIPAVVGVKGLTKTAEPHGTVIVDGLEGLVILNPSEAELAEYERRAEAYQRHRKAILGQARKESRTVDGTPIRVTANLDLADEIGSALAAGAGGVGLYRSEFLFLDHSPALPSEEDHLGYYDRIAQAFYPHRVVIRTLDLGGEKYFHAVLDRTERNPVLGVRAIRFCLRQPEIFRTQLKGILRASKRKNLAILFPMITTLQEYQQASEHLEACKRELKAGGVPFDEHIPVGIMVEVPSCALTAEAYAPLVDFFSIGTNDLIQYLLAIDRNNDSVAHLYDPMHPAVLKCIAHVCDAAAAEGKPVAVCGEAAADPMMTPLLVGLGVSELSMTPSSVLEVKNHIRNLSLRACQKLAKKALKARTGAEVAELVKNAVGGAKG